MFRHNKKTESHISVNLEEPLTGHTCSQIILEVLKYIMYQKQQIPLSCDSLIKLHANSKPSDRNFSAMQNLVNSWGNVSNHLASQFSLEGCDVKKIVIVIGATIVSPKLCIKFELPDKILDSNVHLEHQHSYRKSLLNVMRSMLQCPELQDEMAVPLGLTNTFVLVEKRDPNKISEFFVPKPQFVLSSQNFNTFCVRLNYSEDSSPNCNCDNLIKVYHDSFSGHYTDEKVVVEKLDNESEISYQWFQSREVFKGFKFLR